MNSTLKGILLALSLFLGTWLVFHGSYSLWAAAASSRPQTELELPGPEYAEGARLYRRDCASCHGIAGDGGGELASSDLLFAPRDFRGELFRFISTDNGVASRADVLRTIRRGIPQVGMPPALRCTTEEQVILADYVLALHRLGAGPRTIAGAAVPVPPSPDRGTLPSRGSELFATYCAVCHGADGTAKDAPAFPDSTGRMMRPRDLSSGAFHGGSSDADLYWRIRCGIPGTVMPAFSTEQLDDHEVQQVIGFVRSLSGS